MPYSTDQFVLTLVSNYIYRIFEMFWPTNTNRNRPRSSFDERHQPHIGFFFLDLKYPLTKRVVAGSNKAALFHLLACLSNILDQDAHIFWGACEWQTTVMIAFQCASDNPLIAASDGQTPDDRLAELVQTMKHTIINTPILYSAPFTANMISRDTLTISNSTLHLLITLVLRRYSRVPGAWDAAVEVRPLPVVNKEMKLEKYRVQQGALGWSTARPISEKTSGSDVLVKQEYTLGGKASSQSGELFFESSSSPADEAVSKDDLDWVYIDNLAVL